MSKHYVSINYTLSSLAKPLKDTFYTRKFNTYSIIQTVEKKKEDNKLLSPGVSL